MKQNITHTVNTLKTWDKCQKRFELDVVCQLHWPSNPQNFRLGQTVHTMLDYQAKQLPLEHLIAVLKPDEKMAWINLEKSGWLDKEIIVSEWAFSLCLNMYWLYGRVDRIIRFEENKILIIDWKTGTATPLLPQEDWQTRIYLFAVYTLAADLGLQLSRPEDLAFAYIQVSSTQIEPVKVTTIEYTDAMHQETEQLLLKQFERIESTTQYLLPLQCPDKYCPYSAICGIKTIDVSRRNSEQ